MGNDEADNASAEPKPINGCADRIRQLGEKCGKTHDEIASDIGISREDYWDLKDDDVELTMCLNIREAVHLAALLGVTLLELVSPGSTRDEVGRITLDELASRVRAVIHEPGVSLDQLEDKSGWYLQWFLDNPADALEKSLEFLQDVCDAVGMNWLAAVPDELPNNI